MGGVFTKNIYAKQKNSNILDILVEYILYVYIVQVWRHIIRIVIAIFY